MFVGRRHWWSFLTFRKDETLWRPKIAQMWAIVIKRDGNNQRSKNRIDIESEVDDGILCTL